MNVQMNFYPILACFLLQTCISLYSKLYFILTSKLPSKVSKAGDNCSIVGIPDELNYFQNVVQNDFTAKGLLISGY